MADTLYTIATIANDPLFQLRLNAGAAQQNAPGDPVAWVWNNRYDIAAAPSWAEKVDYWINTHPEPEDPEEAADWVANGWATDPAVITDGDIIAQLQAMIQTPEEPEGP